MKQQLGTTSTNTWILEYDRISQLLEASVRDSTTSALLKQFIYGYDQAGNRTREQIDMSVTTANHNALNQLTNTTGAGPVRFSGQLSEPGMVSVGGSAAPVSNGTNFVAFPSTLPGTNLVAVTATDYSNNSRTNTYEIVVTNSALTRTLRYDLNGNLETVVTATATNTYTWDAANRLLSITQRTATNTLLVSEFTYDGLGRRARVVEKVDGATNSDHVYLWAGTELAEERDATGATVTRRFFGQGEQIGGTNYFFTRDHLGSVREMTDNTGTVRARYDYDPYGRRAKVTGDLEADFGFTGHYVHAASGLHLALFRAYDAEAARWLNRDPVHETGGINLYVYGLGNPLNWVDPLGLFSWSCFGQGFASGVLGAAAVAVVGAFVVGIAPGAAGVVATALLIGGAIGLVASVASMMMNPSEGNISYTLGALTGGGLFGGLSARGSALAGALTPKGGAAPRPPSIMNEIDMRWRNPQNPNSITAGLVNYFQNVNSANSTGPAAISGAITTAGAGAGGAKVVSDVGGSSCQ